VETILTLAFTVTSAAGTAVRRLNTKSTGKGKPKELFECCGYGCPPCVGSLAVGWPTIECHGLCVSCGAFLTVSLLRNHKIPQFCISIFWIPHTKFSIDLFFGCFVCFLIDIIAHSSNIILTCVVRKASTRTPTLTITSYRVARVQKRPRRRPLPLTIFVRRLDFNQTNLVPPGSQSFLTKA
jgi:hypothetical protein